MKTKNLNELLRAAWDIEPLLEFEEPKTMDDEMVSGLAIIYANKGYRKYIKHAIDVAINNAAMCSENELQGAVMKSRIITLKELLSKGKECFEKVDERMKKLKNANN